MDGLELLDRMPLYPRIAPPGPQPGCEDESAHGSVSEGYFYEAPQDKSHRYETPTINIPPVRIESGAPSNPTQSVTLKPLRQQQQRRQSQQAYNALHNNRLRNPALQNNGGLQNNQSRTRNARLQRNGLRNDHNLNVVRLPSTTEYKYTGQGKVVTQPRDSQTRQTVRRTATPRKRSRRISHAGMHSTRQPRKRTSRSRRNSSSAPSSQQKRSWWSDMFK